MLCYIINYVCVAVHYVHKRNVPYLRKRNILFVSLLSLHIRIARYGSHLSVVNNFIFSSKLAFKKPVNL